MGEKVDDSSFSIDLQLFADPDKTEDPTQRRIDKAREEGNVAQSKEFNMAISFLGVTALLYFIGSTLVDDVVKVFYDYFDLNTEIIDQNLITYGMTKHLGLYLKVAILFIGGALISLMLGLIQTRFLLAPKAIKFDISKINPIKGFKNLFSMKKVVELLKSLAKLAVVGILSYQIIVGNMEAVTGLVDEDISASITFTVSLIMQIMFQLGIALLIISLIDFWYQRYEYKKNLRMTKKEVKDEYKDMEGNPEVKKKQKEFMQKIVFSRMIQEVPTADVVVTNPTHYSVAIKYESGAMPAPKVVAKGMDEIAFKIKEVARENSVPIVENPVLARTLYRDVDIDEEITEELYKPVAEVLAYVYNLNKS
ncbi:flagellar biosynthetic protein FlhB [Geotoga petraea]|uniref:Flagellar biosynthetic protein FlhB n=1 Tax=Geotoga petraea TaxID=28234 RepID=A0A1G6K2H4_9BACT|nr:flagellar biosynthesis protein FlhB [Geotoga sp.]TGG88478.1 flagellar biosynthesis protein FlhB [Geotoga petraea]SDC25239.1 flagellar biosynthetic protein FlhB [Geotoga petraea]